MSVVLPRFTASGTNQNAVSRTPTTPTAARRVKFLTGRMINQITTPAYTAKIATTTWLRMVSASSTAGSQSGPRRSSARANVPRKKSDSASAIMNENSPASVLGRLPPMMWKSNVMVASPPSLKNRKPVAASASIGAAGRGARMPRANTYAPAGNSSGPRAVTTLNAMLYGMKTSSSAINTAGNGK